MHRYDVLRLIANHAAKDQTAAMFLVAYLTADLPTEVLERALAAVHELESPEAADGYVALYQERYARRPATPR
jgi:hypothetical protein